MDFRLCISDSPIDQIKTESMTKKDFTNQENIDREKVEGSEAANPAQPSGKAETATGKTYVKNANATGDGAFGRTETSLPEEEEIEEQKEADPPY
jgi:hypothetical protein